MGHNRLGRLPKNHRWKEVIRLIAEGASVPELASATFDAADTGLSRIPHDAGFNETLSVAFQFIDGLQSRDPDAALRQKGFAIPGDASLFDYVAGFKQKASEATGVARAKSDIAEIAQHSFAEVIIKSAGPGLSSFFGVDSADVKKSLQANLKGKPLGSTMHEFFVAFTQRYLNYYLSRELPNHVGQGKTIPSLTGHSDFNKSFDLYVRQTVRIADEFTPGWFGKARYEGRLSSKEVAKFAHVAIKKIRSEMRLSA